MTLLCREDGFKGGDCLLREMAERAYFQGDQVYREAYSLDIVCEGNVVWLGLLSHPGTGDVLNAFVGTVSSSSFNSLVLDNIYVFLVLTKIFAR